MNSQQAIAPDKVSSDIDSSSIEIGMSACLIENEVYPNVGHTQSGLCLDVLSPCFKLTTFCPEVMTSFGSPRPTIRLAGDPSSPQGGFISTDSALALDLASQLTEGCEKRLSEMSHLDGYILMKNAPSCGLERLKVSPPNGHPHQLRTAGVFARALKAQYPLMPIEEEERLHDNKLFDNFLLRVCAYHNFRKEVLEQSSLHNLMVFHSRYKYLLMAHNQEQCRALGRLLGTHKQGSVETLTHTYFRSFIEALSKPASRKNHTNALFHILGYLKGDLPAVAREHIVEIIHNYNKGLIPLTTPLTLLKHHLIQHGSAYIKDQRYLEPHPEKISPMIQYL
jgi:uncharacterized protein YbgA (DUF1722 family)/uncharacterized protein YbbK (DUF523 family)